MSRRRVLGLTILFVAAATLACIGLGSSMLPTGEEAPNFGVKIKGKIKSLKDHRGKVVVINFWSST